MLDVDKILGPQQKMESKPPKHITLNQLKQMLRNGDKKAKDTGSPTKLTKK